MREFIHTTIRNELSKELGDVVVTGHSLGGALAALCAMDIEMHTLGPINIELQAIKNKNTINQRVHTTLPSSLHLSLYSYGSPKVGNASWVELYNKAVPDTFRRVYYFIIYNCTYFITLYVFFYIDNDRIVADGDIIPGLSPLPNYSHTGNEVLIDDLGDSGTIIVNPTYIEKTLIQKTKASVAAHSLDAYMNGLENVMLAAQQQRDNSINSNSNPIVHHDDTKKVLTVSDSLYLSTTSRPSFVVSKRASFTNPRASIMHSVRLKQSQIREFATANCNNE